MEAAGRWVGWVFTGSVMMLLRKRERAGKLLSPSSACARDAPPWSSRHLRHELCLPWCLGAWVPVAAAVIVEDSEVVLFFL